MRKAFCMIRRDPWYRCDAFMAGLKAAGFDARTGPPQRYEAGDVLCMWNRYGDHHALAERFERAGGVVLVAENGYVGPGGISPHQMEPREWYALAIGGHNGSGTWPAGDSSRWDALKVDLKPWRTDGEHILVCPNRSFGRPDLIMPLRWADDVKARLARLTKREIRIRPHPGNGAHPKPLADDLAGAWACVIWSSSAGVQALIRGTPVMCAAPHWICKKAALWDHETEWSDPRLPEPAILLPSPDMRRIRALHRLAWAQWNTEELATGEPFARLIERATSAAVAA